MTLKELKERIDFEYNEHSANCEVRIVVRQEGAVGGTPSVKVKFAGRGIDWDSWKFMLFPENELVEINKTNSYGENN